MNLSQDQTQNFKELQCKLVSTYGLALSCDYPPSYFPGRQIAYKTDPTCFRKGSLVYLHPRHFAEFIRKYWMQIKEPVALLINNDDDTFPYDYYNSSSQFMGQFMASDKLLCIFVQNKVKTHNNNDKVYSLPIGIDYHTMMWEEQCDWGPGKRSALVQELDLLDVKSKLLTLKECKPEAVTNFQHSMDSPIRRKTVRQPIYEATKGVQWITWLPKQTRNEFWLSLKDVAFVLSPPGNGLDTHRTWETLMLGRIPIISATALNQVYKGLPVWEVENWEEFAKLTRDQVQAKLDEFISKWETYEWERLTLEWWQRFMRETIKRHSSPQQQQPAGTETV